MTSQGNLALPATRRIEHELGWHYEDLSDFEFRLVVPGRIIVKKNHLTVMRLGGRTRIGPDGEFKRWQKTAADALSDQWSAVFREPIPKHVELNLAVISYLESRRGWPDLSGTYEGPQDVLEAHRSTCDLTVGVRTHRPKCRRHAGVISNDSQVCGHVGSDRRIDPDNPRVELILTPRR